MHFMAVAHTGEVFVGDARYGTIIDRPKVLEGRMPRPESLDEMAVGFVYAKQHHLRVGGRLTLGFLPSNPYPPRKRRCVAISAGEGLMSRAPTPTRNGAGAACPDAGTSKPASSAARANAVPRMERARKKDTVSPPLEAVPGCHFLRAMPRFLSDTGILWPGEAYGYLGSHPIPPQRARV